MNVGNGGGDAMSWDCCRVAGISIFDELSVRSENHQYMRKQERNSPVRVLTKICMVLNQVNYNTRNKKDKT